MNYWVEAKSNLDDDSSWTLVRLFEFESDAEAWVRRESKMRGIPLKSFRMMNLETEEIKYFE